MELMEKIDYSRAVTNRGNNARIKSVMERASNGEKLTIAFLGGSITQGSVASGPELCYAYRVYRWWCDTFPKASFTYVNGGIGGTTSQFGVARADSDILAYEPDFVIIEFSVNDDSTEHFKETYEGLVRKVYSSPKKPAVMIVHNVCYDNGANAQLMHGEVARHYEIPAVSMQSTIYPSLLSGDIKNREITPDDLHPNDDGHELVASVITYGLEKIKNAPADEPVKAYPAPITPNAYEDSVRYQNYNSSPVCSGFEADKTEQKHITDCFKHGWTASHKGDSITFETEGSCIGVQFKKSVKLPAPVAELTIDDDENTKVILDANFDETWGDKLELYTVAEHISKGKHKVTVKITESHDNDAVPFYLVSVIGSGR